MLVLDNLLYVLSLIGCIHNSAFSNSIREIITQTAITSCASKVV